MSTDNLVKAPEGKPAISPGLSRILLIALAFVQPLVRKIKNEYARTQLERFFAPLNEAIKALADSDPNDAEQIKSILHKFFVSTGFSQDTKLELIKILQSGKVKDPRVVSLLIFLVDWTFDVLPFVLDNEPTDDQLVAFLQAKLRSEQGVAFIQSLLAFLLKDEDTAEWIAMLIAEVLRGVIDSPALKEMVEAFLDKK